MRASLRPGRESHSLSGRHSRSSVGWQGGCPAADRSRAYDPRSRPGLKVTADGLPTYETFFGIRYGQTTAPPNRWLPPKPADWKHVFDATRFGPISEQSVGNGEGVADPTMMNEDSLRLNIWTPTADDGHRPVIVYLHGGGFTQGNPNATRYSGKRFAQDNVVYVDLAYRLGPFGFMDVGSVPGAADEYQASPNLGLLDQRMALQFVHDNIAEFGGDPGCVTLAGGSAGAWSTTIHMALSQSNKLFQRAIVVSGSPQVGDLTWAEKVTDMTMAALGVATFDQLLKATAQQLNDAQDTVYHQHDPNFWCVLYRPIVDNVTIKQDPRKSIRDGEGKDIPLLTGSSADEMRHWLSWADWGTDSSWGPAATIPAVCADVAAHGDRWSFVYERMVANAVAGTGKTPEQVEASYLASHPGETPNDAFFNLLNDLTFRIPAIRMAENRLVAPGHRNNTWMYADTWESRLYLTPAAGGAGDPVNGMPAGAFHEVGLGFAFGLPEEWPYSPTFEFAPCLRGHAGEADYGTCYPVMTWPSQLVPQHHCTWVKFARTGNPNNRYIPAWKPYTTSRRATLLFDATPRVSDDWHGADRLLWESVPGDPFWDCPTDVAIP